MLSLLLACGGPVLPEAPVLGAGLNHLCVNWTDGSIDCWGLDDTDQLSVPEGLWSDVSAGETHTCAVSAEDGRLACWGGKEDGRHLPPKGEFVDVEVGRDHACAISAEDASVSCWGQDERGQADPPGGAFVQLSAGNDRTCGVQEGGALACWGWLDEEPPSGSFRHVAAGTESDCAVTTGGELECWNHSGALPEPDPPGGEGWSAVSIGSGDQSVICHSCAIGDEGLDCWGSCGTYDGPTGEPMLSLASGEGYHCGIRSSDARLVCWGSNGTISGVSTGL